MCESSRSASVTAPALGFGREYPAVSVEEEVCAIDAEGVIAGWGDDNNGRASPAG